MAEKVFCIIACHMIGDYIFQTDFIAKTKGQNWYHLFIHCVLYAVPFWICFGWGWQLAIITIFHFSIDALKARWKKITYWQDQTTHLILTTLFLI